MSGPSYRVYKGLQRPLVYKGFAGKFIFWGIGSIIGGIALGGLVGAVSNMYLGGLVLLSVVAAGLSYTFFKQKGGLHAKTRRHGIFIHPAGLSLHRPNNPSHEKTTQKPVLAPLRRD